MGDEGHRRLPHTADVRIEAWAPSRERCIAEAVTGMVASFADVSGAEPTATMSARIDRNTDEDLLVGALDEVIYLLDTRNVVPASAEVLRDGDALLLHFTMTDAERVRPIGAVPKAVSLHDLRFERRNGGWRCVVTLDV